MRFRHRKNSTAAIGKSKSRLCISVRQSLSCEKFERLVMGLIKNSATIFHFRRRQWATSVVPFLEMWDGRAVTV